MKHHEDHRDYI